MRPFFPDPVFAWVFCGLLFGFVGVAAFLDLKTGKIKNQLSVSLAAVGLILSLIRGGWMGAIEQPLSFLPTGSVWLGLADAFLFSLLGFVLAFGIMWVFWILNLAAGGGDVKLFAAIGIWIGWSGFLFSWVVSFPLLFVWMLARIFFGSTTLKKEQRAAKETKKTAVGAELQKRTRTTYSLPIAVAVVVACLWSYRGDLGLAAKPVPPPENTGATPNDPPSPEQPK